MYFSFVYKLLMRWAVFTGVYRGIAFVMRASIRWQPLKWSFFTYLLMPRRLQCSTGSLHPALFLAVWFAIFLKPTQFFLCSFSSWCSFFAVFLFGFVLLTLVLVCQCCPYFSVRFPTQFHVLLSQSNTCSWWRGGWWRGTVVERRSLAGELSLSRCPALDLQLMGDHSCGSPSATGQPTRPTQPFILSSSINWVVNCNRMFAFFAWVVPSGECLRGEVLGV